MPKQLEFMDCPHCGKRMVTTAPRCGHCKKSPQEFDAELESDTEDPTDHLASDAGYDSTDDQEDYQEFLANEFPESSEAKRPSTPAWIWITAWILLAVIILPLALAVVNLVAKL